MSLGNNKNYFSSWEKISIICYGKHDPKNDLLKLSEEEYEYLQIIKGILSEKYNSKKISNQDKTYINELNKKFEEIKDIDVRLLATVLFKTLVNKDLPINVPQIARNVNKNKFFSKKFLEIIGGEKNTIYKSYENVANLLKLNQGKVFEYLQSYDGNKKNNGIKKIGSPFYDGDPENIESTLNFNLGLFTPINYCIYRETTEPKKARGILNKFIEAAEKNEYLKTLVPNGMFSKKSNNLKKELIIKDIINYIPGEKYQDLYYHKKKGYIYNSNENKFIFKSRKKNQEIYISSLGFAIFIKADIDIIKNLIDNGADFRNVFKMDGYVSDALVFISIMINVFLKEHLESIIKINGKDFKIKNYIPEDNNIFNLILKDSNNFYDEIEKYNKSTYNFIKNKKELSKRNNLREIYSTLVYFKSLFKYFLQLYYKKTNLNLLGHKGYRAAEIATKGFYGHFLKMTTVNAINSIRKNLNKNSEESEFLKNYMKSLNNQIKERKEEIKNNKYMTRMIPIFRKSQKSQNTTQSNTSVLAKLAKFGNRLGSTVSFNFDLENAFYVLTWFYKPAFKLWCIIYSLQLLKKLSLKIYRGATRLIQRNYIISNIEEYEKYKLSSTNESVGGKKVLKKKSPVKKTVKKPVKKIIKKSTTKKKITTKKTTK